MFVTINAKHTRLNASHLVSLSAVSFHRDDALATRTTWCGAERPRVHRSTTRSLPASARRARRRRSRRSSETVRDRCLQRARRCDPHGREEVFRELLQAIALVFGGAGMGEVPIDPPRRCAVIRVALMSPSASTRNADRGDFAQSVASSPVGPPHRRSAVRDRRQWKRARRPSNRSPRN